MLENDFQDQMYLLGCRVAAAIAKGRAGRKQELIIDSKKPDYKTKDDDVDDGVSETIIVYAPIRYEMTPIDLFDLEFYIFDNIMAGIPTPAPALPNPVDPGPGPNPSPDEPEDPPICDRLRNAMDWNNLIIKIEKGQIAVSETMLKDDHRTPEDIRRLKEGIRRAEEHIEKLNKENAEYKKLYDEIGCDLNS